MQMFKAITYEEASETYGQNDYGKWFTKGGAFLLNGKLKNNIATAVWVPKHTEANYILKFEKCYSLYLSSLNYGNRSVEKLTDFMGYNEEDLEHVFAGVTPQYLKELWKNTKSGPSVNVSLYDSIMNGMVELKIKPTDFFDDVQKPTWYWVLDKKGLSYTKESTNAV